MSERWGMHMARANNVAYINPSMEETPGLRLSIRVRRSAFRTWRSVLATRSFCLPVLGIRIVLRGARMLPLMDPAVAFTALKMEGRRGRASMAVDYRTAIGVESELMWRRTASACTQSLQQRKVDSIVQTTAATHGFLKAATHASPAVRGISAASPSIRRIQTSSI